MTDESAPEAVPVEITGKQYTSVNMAHGKAKYRAGFLAGFMLGFSMFLGSMVGWICTWLFK